MKKLLFTIILLTTMPMMMKGQTFSSLWKQVAAAQGDDLPQTEQKVLSQIVVKAAAERAYGQLLKAELQRARSICNVAPDSLRPVVERLKQRVEEVEGDVPLQAIYNCVLGYVYQQNSWLDVDRHEEIKASNLRVIPSKKDGVVVKMKATMPSNISIPLAVANLQKQIKQYVMASSGVAVKNVIVTVEKTSGAVAVSNIDETLAETNVEKPAEEKTDDKPVHQRLFERHDAPEAAPETAEPAPAPDEETMKEEKTDE